MPAAQTVIGEPVIPFDHTEVAPATNEPAVSVTQGLVQVILPLDVAVIAKETPVLITVTEAVPVQPVAGSVTVTV